jgi:hypothetical protein
MGMDRKTVECIKVYIRIYIRYDYADATCIESDSFIRILFK